jgi:hypothetical protein|tara:strand:+ start:69 stop:245 length:177 start_codon:yes stop_codon:yes gene_type:complete
MFGKNKKKKSILGLEGQAYLDAYNRKMNDTGKTTLAEKARFVKETTKIRNKMIKSGGM